MDFNISLHMFDVDFSQKWKVEMTSRKKMIYIFFLQKLLFEISIESFEYCYNFSGFNAKIQISRPIIIIPESKRYRTPPQAPSS